MNLDYLKSFYYIAQCNSISKASEILHVTQPGLSMQLKSLESELGFSLMSRSNKGVLLTSEGEIVYDYAKSIFTLEENMYNSINSLEQKKNTLFIASARHTVHTSWLSIYATLRISIQGWTYAWIPTIHPKSSTRS